MLLVTLLVTSCGKDAESDRPTPNSPSGNVEITLTVPELVLPDSNPVGTLSFSASADWSVSLSETKAVPDWLTVEPMSGKAGQATLTITAQPNENYEDRSAIITICSGSASKSLPVYQKKKNALILSKDKYELSDEATDIDVEVKSNIDFEVKILNDWITQVQTKGLTTHQLKFHIAANEWTDNREGRIVIKSKSSDLADTVHVYQSRQNSLVLNQREYSVSEEGGTIDVVLKSNMDFTVQMPDVDWIEEVQTKSLQTYKYQCRILPNETYDGREAQIVFKDNNSNLADTVFIYQTTKDALLLSKDHYELEADGGNIDIEVKNNIDFEVKILDDWITQVQTNGLTTHQLKFTITENPNSERTGHIVFKDRNSNLSDTVSIIQEGYADGIAQDREALIALYNATGGDNWNRNDNWCSDKPLNEWYGVTTNYTTGRVSEISLPENNLSGTLPDEIKQLTALHTLNLNFNNFTEIPAIIGEIQSLEYFSMYSNTSPGSPLSGNIPSSLGNLLNLKRLSINGDFGPLPDELGSLTQLEWLDIGGSWYGRSISEPIPSWIQKFKKLQYLALGSLNLSGDIPNWIYDLTELQELHLPCNALTGTISENICNLKLLTYLTLNNNKLSGTIPSSLTLLTNLQHCYLNDNDLEGTLPEGFATLTNLLTLHTYGNRMSGQIPEDFKQNPNFESWGVAQNILPQQPGYTLYLGSSYESSDYSADGEVMILQTATIGKGVDIVLLGDGFVDRDMDSGGKYEQAMQEAYEYLFALEPMKSYREYFNVYAVKAVSKHEQFGYGNETALNAVFGGGVYVSGNDDKCFEYAQKAPIHSVDQVTIAVALNISAQAGTTFWHGQDAAVAYIGMHRPGDGFYEKTFEATFIHEVVGHGIGKLADEYVYNNEYFPSEFIEQENEIYQTYGWNANISYSSDPEQVRWKHMLNDPRYSTYTGLVEGANLYAYGVWRPEENSMMSINSPYFNAPSREAIVKRIKRLAGETYSFEEFAAKDKYEPVVATKSMTNAAQETEIVRLPSPVIVRK